MKNIFLSSASIAAFIVSSPALAQADENTKEVVEFEEIVVTSSGSRLPDSIETYPGSVTIIGKEELKAILAIDNDLGAILGKHIPGFGTSGGKISSTNFDHTLRGRKPTVLVDGIPITTPLRDGAQDFRSIHPSVLGSIEVIRGATALYGNGGAGGVINYITKTPDEGDLSFFTKVDLGFSLNKLSDSWSPSITQGVSGKSGSFDFIVNGHVQWVGSFYDADGTLIPADPHDDGGIADTTSYDIFAKVGHNFGDQRIEVMATHYNRKQDSDYIKIDGDFANNIPTSSVLGEDPRSADLGIENTLLSMNYSHSDVMGSAFRLQEFYRRADNIFSFSDYFPGGGQSFIHSKKFGGRLDVTTPLDDILEGADVLWGMDYLNDKTGQGLLDGRLFAPAIRMKTVAGFAQFKIPVGEWLVLRGGIRHENISLDVPNFTTLFSEVDIAGGNISYSATPVNIGAVINLTDHFDFVTSYSQGFSVSEVGRLLRQQDLPGNVEDLELEASVIDSYEAGFRGTWETWGFQLAFYENRSNLGTRVRFIEETGQFRISLAPERVQGLELSFTGSPTDEFRWGTTVSLISGNETTPDRTPLSGRSIPPGKVTGYIEYDISDSWNLRVQGLYSGSRDEFPGSLDFGEAKIDSFKLVDVSTSFDMGPGRITLSVDNLLNEDYFSNLSQLQADDCCFSKASGRSGSISYTINY